MAAATPFAAEIAREGHQPTEKPLTLAEYKLLPKLTSVHWAHGREDAMFSVMRRSIHATKSQDRAGGLGRF
jgi:hypothetical protein